MRSTNWMTKWLAALAIATAAAVIASVVASGATERRQALPAANGLASFEGKLSLDDGLVKLKVVRVLTPGNARITGLLLGRKALLDVGLDVRISDTRGAQIPFPLIDDAIARVSGRLLPTGAWRWDGDDLRPVIATRRIAILQLDRD